MNAIFARCSLFFVLVVIAVSGPARADDASQIKAVITSQLEAFRADDGSTAYAHAAPAIQSMFGSKERFMEMVRSGYPPIYRSSNVSFGDLVPEGQGFRQDVFMTGAKGQSWVASYTLERQDDGTLKITGVTLKKSGDLAV